MRYLFFIFLMVLMSGFAQENYLTVLKKHRQTLNTSFKDAKNSPLSSKKRKSFKGLPFFKIDKNFKVKAKLKYTFNAPIKYLRNTDGKTEAYQQYALATFILNQQEYTLSIYQSLSLKNIKGYENYLFIPFTDNTNGKTTYSGGRYLDNRIPKNATGYIELDFNKAYNPYCAYSTKYACPIPPKNNHLDIKVLAGVKY